MVKLFLILSVLFAVGYSQSIDKTFCDIDAIVEDPEAASNPLPDAYLDTAYEAVIEHNERGFTEEISEWFNGPANIARSRTVASSITDDQYIYPNSKELLTVLGSTCSRDDLSNDPGLVEKKTSFMLVNDKDGKSKLAGGTFGFLYAYKKYVDPSLKIKYIGNSKTARGIPVRQWTACLFDVQKVETTKIILSYSDPKTWTPAHNVANKTVPVQLEVSKKIGSDINSEISSILSYRDNILIKEEDLYTPSGIYCPGRTNLKEMPKIPDLFSTWMQISEPKHGSYGLAGDVKVIKSEFDYKKNLYNLEYYVNDHRIKEVHDWNTGLLYKADRDAYNCEISKLNANDTISLSDLFKLDQDPPFQWTGQSVVRGINTDVWTAPRQWKNMDTVWEYHFATEAWADLATGVSQRDPVLLTITYGKYDPFTPRDKEYVHFLEWDITRVDWFDFDVTSCQSNIENKHIRFEIKPEESDYEVLKKSQKNFKVDLTNSILQTTGIGLTRIGELETAYHNKTIFVTFTLFDKPEFYGINGVVENDLNTCEAKLNTSIQNEQFSVTVDKIVTKPDKNSYIILEKREGRYVYEIRESGETINYSIGSVIAFLIVFALVGIISGFVAGYFLIIKRTTALPQLPGPLGFLNPSFAGESNA